VSVIIVRRAVRSNGRLACRAAVPSGRTAQARYISTYLGTAVCFRTVVALRGRRCSAWVRPNYVGNAWPGGGWSAVLGRRQGPWRGRSFPVFNPKRPN